MYILCDIETTGLDYYRNDPITIALGIVDNNFTIIDKILVESRPTSFEFWSFDSEEIHGISRKQALSFQEPEKACEEVISFLEKYNEEKYIFVCHAYPWKSSVDLFDYRFMDAWFEKLNRSYDFYKLLNFFNRYDPCISTIKRGHENLKKYGIENQKLSTWAKKLKFNLKHHDAMSDMLCLYEIFKYQMNFNDEFMIQEI